MLELQNIGITFNSGTPDENKVLDGINLKINKGDFITVIGSNGAGKSTLYNIIAGTLKPTTGRLLLDRDESGNARDITNDPEYKRACYIGRIFQNPLLGTAGKMSLEDNLVIARKKGPKPLRISLNNHLRETFRTQLKELNMGLENRLRDNVEQFSGGQRQALTLLMAVMSRPDLLLLDEHTAALDPANAELVMLLTLKFTKEFNLTTMMVTHNMQHALDYGNRLIMMHNRKIIFDVSGQEKQKLTKADLIDKFRQLNVNNDNLILQ